MACYKLVKYSRHLWSDGPFHFDPLKQSGEMNLENHFHNSAYNSDNGIDGIIRSEYSRHVDIGKMKLNKTITHFTIFPYYTLTPFTVYPKKYAHGFVVLCFVVVMQSFIMNSHEVFIHIHQGCFAGTGAIVRLPQCQWSKPDGYAKISQCITTTKHSKAKTVCIFLGIYCNASKNYGRNNKKLTHCVREPCNGSNWIDLFPHGISLDNDLKCRNIMIKRQLMYQPEFDVTILWCMNKSYTYFAIHV